LLIKGHTIAVAAAAAADDDDVTEATGIECLTC